MTCEHCGECTLPPTCRSCSLSHCNAAVDSRILAAGNTQLSSSNELNTLTELVALVNKCFDGDDSMQGGHPPITIYVN